MMRHFRIETGEFINPARLFRHLTRDEKRLAVLSLLGGKCSSIFCRWQNADESYGCNLPTMLQIDHIHEDGPVDKLWNNSAQIIEQILVINKFEGIDKVKEKYQLLCANCNWHKRYLNKEVRGTKKTPLEIIEQNINGGS